MTRSNTATRPGIRVLCLLAGASYFATCSHINCAIRHQLAAAHGRRP